MLAKKNRISNRKLIAKLSQKGVEHRTTHLIFRYLLSGAPPPQFAITVSSKIVKTAVERNRLRRQIAEAVQQELPGLSVGVTALIIARDKARVGDHQRFTEEMTQFFNHLNRNAK